MELYKVYFELYGHKMMKRVEAHSRENAMQQIACDIIFHKVSHDIDPEVQNIANLLGIKL